MDLSTIEKITPELQSALIGKRFGRVFQMSKTDFIIDFRLDAGRYLFISGSPADPRIYLVRRRLRDIERSALPPSAFANSLRKNFANAVVTTVSRLPEERVITIELEGESELGVVLTGSLLVQLTGKSANLFITNNNGIIDDRLRMTRGDGQEIGTTYSPPARQVEAARGEMRSAPFQGLISEELDRLDLEKAFANAFRSAVNAAKARFKQRRAKLKRRKEQLENDLISHGDAEKWKRYGDLLLANVATTKRSGQSYLATDYFDESLPTIAVPYDNDDSVTETAEKYFRKYTKARNAKDEVSSRMTATDIEISELDRLGSELDGAIEEKDLDKITGFLSGKKAGSATGAKKKSPPMDGVARSFTSSDGFEILVGKRAKDNDALTFKIAKSLDVWMHAADYPGSHVVIRNPNRQEIPHRTLIEAAELAAFYSQGKAQVKAAVNYTQKKFVNKPKGAAPGLVSLSSFKTLLVEPRVPDTLEG